MTEADKPKPLVLCDDVDDHPDMTCHVYALATIERVDFATAFRAIHHGTSPEEFVAENGYNAEVTLEAYAERIARLGYRRVSKRYKGEKRNAIVIVQWHRGYRIRTLHTVAWCHVARKHVDCAGYDSVTEKKATLVAVFARVAEPEATIAELGAPHPCEAMFKRGRELEELRASLRYERRNLIEEIERRERAEARTRALEEGRRWEALRQEADRRAGLIPEEQARVLNAFPGALLSPDTLRGVFLRAMAEGLRADAQRARERLALIGWDLATPADVGPS